MDPLGYILFSWNHNCVFYNTLYDTNIVLKQKISRTQEEERKKTKKIVTPSNITLWILQRFFNL